MKSPRKNYKKSIKYVRVYLLGDNKMKIYFTADCHFNHKAIIKYSERPFKDLNHMNESIIQRWNSLVNPDDLVYHLGDFAFKNSGNKFEQRLNGTIVHILGNHDGNNGVKSYITHAIMKSSGLIILASHRPPDSWQSGTVQSNLIDLCDLILCGHVHNEWQYAIIRNKYAINVGVDVWDYQPITLISILKRLAKIKKGYYTNIPNIE